MATIKLTGFNTSTGRSTTAGDTDVVDLDGSLTIGNADTDAVVFNAEIDSDFIPDDNNTYDIGSSSKEWANVYTTSVNVSGVATYNTVEYFNSNTMKFNQYYLGNASGSYFSANEYQKVVTIIPSANSQNYQVIGRITAQNAGETHTVYFNVALRSETLPDLDWSISYREEYNGNRYIDPQLWTKETTTAGFIVAFKTLATIYGNVTVDIDVVPRASDLKANVTINDSVSSEQANVDTGYTARAMTKVSRTQGQNTTFEGKLTVAQEAQFDRIANRTSTLITGATGTTTHNTRDGSVFYHESLGGDFSADFTNLSIPAGNLGELTLILEQAASARMCTGVKINGVGQTILWEGGTQPSGTGNGFDLVTFKVLYDGTSYLVMGKSESYS